MTFTSSSPLVRRAVVAALIVLALAGTAVTAATSSPPTPTRTAAAPAWASAAPPAAAQTAIDHLTAVAQQRYATEVGGSQTRATLRRVASDPALLAALRSGNLTSVRTYVRREFNRVWRNYPVDVVVRGRDAAHVRTSLPAALNARLPDRGTANVAGARYQVRSFTQTALGGEPVRVWILQRG